MRYWSIILHFYQPPTQEAEITKQVVDSCYLPLLRMLSQKSGFKLTFNICGSLLLQLQQLGVTEFFDLTKKLISDGKIELLNSVMYHPLIPLTPPEVVVRQIKKNSDTLKKILGVEGTAGFFPPELAIDKPSLDDIKTRLVVVDENALGTKSPGYKPLVKYGPKYLLVNNRLLCDLLRSYPIQLPVQIVVDMVKKNTNEEGLVVMANDAELFGHHYSERLQLLSDLLDSTEIKFITSSEAVDKFGPQSTSISQVYASTWQEHPEFSLWNENALQKQYLHLVKTAHEITIDKLDDTAADLIDQAFSSCYIYWLSNWPWWHPGLVEKGAQALINGVRSSAISVEHKTQLEDLYQKFLVDMWKYHESGIVATKYKEYEAKLLTQKNKWLSQT